MKPSEKLSLVTRSKCVPLIAVVELTRRCNLKCRHCYIDAPRNPNGELSTAKVKVLLSQLAASGCLNLVFTGGEIFLRGDLIELCVYARSKGFDLRLFTNGTLIDACKAKALSKLGLGGVEISLYGREAAHDKVTGVKGSFSRTVAAVNMLNEYGIHLTIKCPLMKMNFAQRKWMLSFAEKLGAQLRFDATIAPKDNGDKSVLKYRLSGRQMSRLFSDPEISGEPPAADGDPDFTCSAGRNMVTIGFDGEVYPCLQLRTPLGNVKKQVFSKIWSDGNPGLSAFRKLSIKDFPKCLNCDLALICRRCPGIALLEDKTLTGPSAIACKIARIEGSIAKNFQ